MIIGEFGKRLAGRQARTWLCDSRRCNSNLDNHWAWMLGVTKDFHFAAFEFFNCLARRAASRSPPEAEVAANGRRPNQDDRVRLTGLNSAAEHGGDDLNLQIERLERCRRPGFRITGASRT